VIGLKFLGTPALVNVLGTLGVVTVGEDPRAAWLGGLLTTTMALLHCTARAPESPPRSPCRFCALWHPGHNPHVTQVFMEVHTVLPVKNHPGQLEPKLLLPFTVLCPCPLPGPLSPAPTRRHPRAV
jgi:hypothetical protein